MSALPEGAVPFRARLGDWLATKDGRELGPAELPGQVVNIGTKDGLVYERTTVTAMTRYEITVSGGTSAWVYANCGEPRPVTTATIKIYDIARGFIWPGDVSENDEQQEAQA